MKSVLDYMSTLPSKSRLAYERTLRDSCLGKALHPSSLADDRIGYRWRSESRVEVRYRSELEDD